MQQNPVGMEGITAAGYRPVYKRGNRKKHCAKQKSLPYVCCATDIAPERPYTTPMATFDIFTREADGAPLWVEAAESLEVAKARIVELSSVGGAYGIYDSVSATWVIPCKE